MTVYEEEKFLDRAINSIYEFADCISIVEGAYQQTIRNGNQPRSQDKTIEILESWKNKDQQNKINISYFNGESDQEQRTHGLEFLKQQNCDNFLIVDGDEVYETKELKKIKFVVQAYKQKDVRAAYFQSLTFVNDFQHYTPQEFPRFFKLTPGCYFSNDNYVNWEDYDWQEANFTGKIIKAPIRFFHYSFCKDFSRFLKKKTWWETRFKDRNFIYDWDIVEQKIQPMNAKIYEYNGPHP